jgi:protein gp37
MGKNSNIDWTDHTWNPWQGCRKVSPGCANCYMFRDKKRFGQDPENVIRSKPVTFNKPLSWKTPAKVFVCSWSDFFIEDADPWRDEAWDIMRTTPHLTYLLLTKRIDNVLGNFPANGWPLNVWLGVTAENQQQWDYRVSRLKLFTNVPVRFVSVEPMLNQIEADDLDGIDWVICGGESGSEARNMEPYWAEDLRLECLAGNTPFFMKQMSGSGKAQREAIPEYLMVREFPRGL